MRMMILMLVNSLVEFRIISDAWAFDKLQTRNFSELIYFLVMKVDKTKLGKDVHENNDNIDKDEPGPASDVIENKIEAFELLASFRRDLVLTLLKKIS